MEIVGIEQAPLAEPDLESRAAAANDPTRTGLSMRCTEIAQEINDGQLLVGNALNCHFERQALIQNRSFGELQLG